MKKLSILLHLMVIATAIGMGSCSSFSSEPVLKTEVDTVSFYFGLARADGIKNYLTMQAGIDTAHMEAFYKGFRDGAENYGPEKVAYAEGLRIAHLINNQWVDNVNKDLFMGDSGRSINRQALLAGFYNAVKKSDAVQITHAQTQSQLMMSKLREEYRKEKFAASMLANEQFLSNNKNKEGVRTTESGLQYKIITKGRGELPGERSTVKVNYKGTLIDGTEFDSSSKNNTPSTFRVNQVIKGWSEALKMMSAGSRWELYIPHELGYGSTGQGAKIPPYSTLIFDVELVEVEAEK
jgi:FKBP-type peptidyl-prolyl cis-trans isomerase FklB